MKKSRGGHSAEDGRLQDGPLETPLGATLLAGGRCRFNVWAPFARRVEIRILGHRPRLVRLVPGERGYHAAVAERVTAGTRYEVVLDGERRRPDPASRFQPAGVHGPSQVVDPAFAWADAGFTAPPLAEYVLYELHVGTFTQAGTFDAVHAHLAYLRDLGVTALEVMPVAAFPGERNWGYDGVHPFAVQASYGGPDGLKRLVDACHAHGLAVALDVVYNHLGPEGNYLADFGPYFSRQYRTPWGAALNFDDAGSDEVRRYFVENALSWVEEFHVDALRLDAVYNIRDHSAHPFLAELSAAVHTRAARLGRRVQLLGEGDGNDPRFVRPREAGGHGLDAVWNDDFHHALHALLTGERPGYYVDYGEAAHLARALAEGFVLAGQHSRFRGRRHGSPSHDVPPVRFVIHAQNHDQVGNRPGGERLAMLVSFEKQKLAAGALLLAPSVPLLFMGEEWGETAPFLYFVSHDDGETIGNVRRGRTDEAREFGWAAAPPDPQDAAAFLRSKVDHALRAQEPHRKLLGWYRALLQLRRARPALRELTKERLAAQAWEEARVVVLRRATADDAVFAVLHFGDAPCDVARLVPPGRWRKLLDSAAKRWRGRGSAAPEVIEAGARCAPLMVAPASCVVYGREGGGVAGRGGARRARGRGGT